MARYKGKRVGEPLPPNEEGKLGDPFAEETPAAQERTGPAGDPFEDSSPAGGGQDYTPETRLPVGERLIRFAQSKKGKITIGVIACLLILAVGAGAALRRWVRPPEPTPGPTGGQTQDQTQTPGGTQGDPGKTPDDTEPPPPTDDELYPDDGYDGDMPTVTGDRKEGVYTFLLVGTDKDDGNTDTMMVVSYDTVNQDVNIMSIPRDTMINVSWDIKKINSIYSRYGTPENGMDHLLTQISRLIGFRPDYYVKVELSMFVQLVDLVGGVEFDVPQDMNYDDPYQDLHIHLKKGVQVLDGEKAMELVRFRRYSEGDIKRVEVQQDFMKALIKTCLKIEHWGKIKAYIDLAMENVTLSEGLDYGNVVWFAAQALGLGSAPALSMDDVYTCTIPGDYWGSTWSRDTHQDQSYVTVYANDTVKLVNEKFNHYQQKVTTGMLDIMSILSNGDIASSTGSVRDTKHNDIMAVRRGEAYYDDEGNIVYGQKPPEVKQDEFGSWYIEDENGNIIYTDENGTPLDNNGNPVGGETQPPDTEPGGGETQPPDTNPGGGETQPPDTNPGGETQPPDTNPGGEGTQPPETGPGEGGEGGGEDTPPDWLF